MQGEGGQVDSAATIGAMNESSWVLSTVWDWIGLGSVGAYMRIWNRGSRLVVLGLVAILLAGCGSFRRGVDSIAVWEADPITRRFEFKEEVESNNLLILLRGEIQNTAEDKRPFDVRHVEYALNQVEGLDEDEYKLRRRAVLESLRRTSNRSCDEFKLDLARRQARSNFVLGAASLAFGTAGAVSTSLGAARSLAGSAAFTTGTRSEINQTYFINRTAAVLVRAIDKRREILWSVIADSMSRGKADYSMRAALTDIETYHAACSLSGALFQTEQAIEQYDVNVAAKQALERAKLTKALSNLLRDGGKLSPRKV